MKRVAYKRSLYSLHDIKPPMQTKKGHPCVLRNCTDWANFISKFIKMANPAE